MCVTCLICFLLYILTFYSSYNFLFNWYAGQNSNESVSYLSEDGRLLVEDHFPIVKTSDGLVEGYYLINELDKSKYLNAKKVAIFSGIPFASPPVGKLRFKKPIPVTPWKGIKQTQSWPPTCIQHFPSFISDVMKPRNITFMSEDCLYLNVWTSNLNSSKLNEKSSQLKPVVVWIHGGAFQFGSSSNYETDGSILASLGDVILVSPNYRLNAFGFLNLDTNEYSGNMGLYDQYFALKWVKDNIKNFGGDPQKITLWGESSGAVSVTAHLVSPFSRRLFNRMILQSGSLFLQEVVYAQYEQVAETFLKLINCKNESSISSINLDDDNMDEDLFDEKEDTEDEELPKFSPASIECLLKASTESILKAVIKMNEENPMTFFISPNENFLDFSSAKNIRENLVDFISEEGKEILLGFNSDEGSLILNSMLPEKFPKYSSPKISTSIQEARDLLQNLFVNRFRVPKAFITTALPSYLPERNFEIPERRKSSDTNITKGIADFIGDNVFVCPVITFAESCSKLNANGDPILTKVFMYEFNRKTSYTSKLSPWLGAVHYSEVPLTFGYPLRENSGFSESEKEFGQNLMNSWVRFIHTG